MMLISKESNSQLLSEDAIPLKGRSREIYLELCSYIENLPTGCSLPSLRELQKKYSAGQQTIVNALKLLKKNRKVTKTSQKKIKVSSEVKPSQSSASTAFTGLPWIVESQSTEVIMTVERHYASIWQPVVDRFNNTESGSVRLNIIDNFKDCFPFGMQTDFIHFPTNPISLGLVPDTSMFMDLENLADSLNKDEIMASVLIADPSNRIWGIAPTLSPSVIFRNSGLDESLDVAIPRNWDFADFKHCLKQLRKQFPKLPYIHSFYGYISFLFHMGTSLLDQDTGKIKLNLEHMVEPLEYLKQLVATRMIPLSSDTFKNNRSLRMFNQTQIIMRDGWPGEVGAILENVPHLDILPVPTKQGQHPAVYSENFCIMSDSLSYDACWQFIQYTLSPEIQQYLAMHTGNWPARKGIIPKNMSKEQFEFLSEYVPKCVRRTEDYYLPYQSSFVIEAGIDRWIKHGGKLAPLLKDLEKSCQWHIDNVVWSKWK
jgi:ABC-type glycerol-3-phosphate transport system substrate-binding protein